MCFERLEQQQRQQKRKIRIGYKSLQFNDHNIHNVI